MVVKVTHADMLIGVHVLSREMNVIMLKVLSDYLRCLPFHLI